MSKICKKCKKEKPLSEFRKDIRTKSGWMHQCADCKRAYDRARWWRKREYLLQQHSEWKLRNRHQMTLEEKVQMWEGQEKRCLICKKVITLQQVCIDHNHRNGKTRGILCNSCNRGIGYLQDNPKILQDAANYLLTFS